MLHCHHPATFSGSDPSVSRCVAGPGAQAPWPTWSAYGRWLHRLLTTDAACALLPAGATSWIAGGCHTLAQALLPLLPGATLYLLGGSGRAAQHVVVRVTPTGFLDGDGAATRRTLLVRWHCRERVTAPFLHPYDVALLGPDFDPATPTEVIHLTRFLQAHQAAARERCPEL